MRVTLVRHAESTKNLIDIIGGDGARLTIKGRLAARRLSAKLRRVGFRAGAAILYAPAVQTEQTARILGRNGQLFEFVEKSSFLKPISLGALSGISVDEALVKHPAAMQSLRRWNLGEIDISQVDIPGMQNLNEFYLQGLSLMLQAKKRKVGHIFVVATRSSLILLGNIFKRGIPESGGGYVNMPFLYARPRIFKLKREDIGWINQQFIERSKMSETSGSLAS